MTNPLLGEKMNEHVHMLTLDLYDTLCRVKGKAATNDPRKVTCPDCIQIALVEAIDYRDMVERAVNRIQHEIQYVLDENKT